MNLQLEKARMIGHKTSIIATLVMAFALALAVSGLAKASSFGEVTVGVNDVSSNMIVGAGNGANIGNTVTTSVVDIGDVNGDGIDDMAFGSTGSGSGAVNSRGIYVVYTPADPNASIDLLDLKPDEGYRIRTAVNGSLWVNSADDQNGDGVGDFLISDGTNLAVIYGVAPTAVDALPQCGGTNIATRCLDIPSMAANPFNPVGGGFKITGGLPGGFMPNRASVGDFNGDGKSEIMVDGPTSCHCLYVLPGEMTPPASGVLTVPEDLPENTLTIQGIDSGPFSQFGYSTFTGDLNGDGKDDIAFTSTTLGDDDGRAHIFGLYGSDATGNLNAWDISPGHGFQYDYGAKDQFLVAAGAPRPVNGFSSDGRPGLAIASAVALPDFTQLEAMTMVQTPSDSQDFGPFQIWPPSETLGYQINSADIATTGGFQSMQVDSIGDIDGDGIDDVATGQNTTVDGQSNAGRMTVFFSKRSVPGGLTWGPEMSGEFGFTLVGTAGLKVGTRFTGLGDIDGDGLSDFAVSGQPASGSSVGAIYIVRGKELLARAKTDSAVGVNSSSAALLGSFQTNGRNVGVKFEYGPTSEYGSETDPESFNSWDGGTAVTNVNGLVPDTTYHYRAVVTNSLGLTRYGADRTFTTDAAPTPPPPDRCTADPTAKWCPGYTYDFCKENPTSSACKTPVPVARLTGPVANAGQSKVKRGKSTSVTALLISSGDAALANAKLCISGPSKLVQIKKKCVKVGSVGAGDIAKRSFKVKVKKKAKKGKTATLTVTASANSVNSKKDKVKIKIG